MEIGGAEESYLGIHPTRAQETPRARNTENADHSHRSLQLHTVKFVRSPNREQSQNRRVHIRNVGRAIGSELTIVKKDPLHNFGIDGAVITAPGLFVRLDQILRDAA